MITNPKVGQRVWAMHLNTPHELTVDYVATDNNIRFMGDGVWRGTTETFVFFGSIQKKMYLSSCFPSLKSLLEHLEQTAVYYDKEKV